MNDELWQAIISNDASYDGKFYYGVSTTGIFCRPSCKSRNPNREHVKLFKNAEQALAERYRPCKRCRPDGKRLPDEDWVQQISETIEKHYREPLSLGRLADLLHGSPYHLHRTFKRIRGLTPGEYIQQLRLEASKRLLADSQLPITDVALQSGFSNAAYFAAVFHKKTGISPSEYRLARGVTEEGRQGAPLCR